MACCKICCGCKECAEGEEGKCCCGNECCTTGTYCCNAECVSACTQGQAGDCKCATECCTSSEYCCDGSCVGACGEGGAGPCKCDLSCCAEGEYCCNGECQAEPCGHWCQVEGLDDSERVVCVADRDPDRAAIQRTGELLNIGSPPPCLQPGGTCFECLAYATICTDPGLPEGWEGLNWTCAEAREFAELQITNFLSGTFDCEFEIVEKLRGDRTGLEVFDPDLGQFVPLPNAFVKRDWIGCCNQEDAPP